MRRSESTVRRWHPPGRAAAALLISAVVGFVSAMPATAATLDRIREANKVTFGYWAEASPFSFADGSGKPTGFSVALCEKIADEIKGELGISELAIEWVPLTIEDRFANVDRSKIDLLCSGIAVTLDNRKLASFSIPIYPGGVAAVVRADSQRGFRDVLEGRPPTGPVWRGSPARILTGKTVSVVPDTTAAAWIEDQFHHFQITTTAFPVDNYAQGVARVLDGASDVFFGQRPILIEAVATSPAPDNLIILEKHFTSEDLGLALALNDDNFRLVVDRALSRFFPTDDFRDLYTRWFGAPDDSAVTFYRRSALPD